jgi:F-type H+-transporting ATPase subunit b
MLIDWFTVLAQMLNFLILVGLMQRYLFKPILTALDEREKQVAAGLDEAAARKTESETIIAEFQAKTTVLEEQRTEAMYQVQREAAEERQRLLDETRNAVDALRTTLEQSYRSEAQEFLSQVASQVQSEAYAQASVILKHLANEDLESRVVSVFLDRMKGLPQKEQEQFTHALRAANSVVIVKSAFELGLEVRASIRQAIEAHSGATALIDFRTNTDVVCGIELFVDGQKFVWTFADTLEAFEGRMRELLSGSPRFESASNTKGLALEHDIRN